MPDWFYRTVSRPVLFRLSATRAREIALGVMGRLARLPLGPGIIDFLGHMRPDARLRRSLSGIDFPTVIGLGPGLDTGAVALPALARFGFGFLEVGPVTVEEDTHGATVERLEDRQALWLPEPAASLSLGELTPRLAEACRAGLPLIVRLGYSAGTTAEEATKQCQRTIHECLPYAQLF